MRSGKLRRGAGNRRDGHPLITTGGVEWCCFAQAAAVLPMADFFSTSS